MKTTASDRWRAIRTGLAYVGILLFACGGAALALASAYWQGEMDTKRSTVVRFVPLTYPGPYFGQCASVDPSNAAAGRFCATDASQ